MVLPVSSSCSQRLVIEGLVTLSLSITTLNVLISIGRSILFVVQVSTLVSAAYISTDLTHVLQIRTLLSDVIYLLRQMMSQIA